jgi:Uncharacterized protein conserved in bacteria
MGMRRATVAAAVIAALLLLLAGPGVRLGLWTFRLGFSMLRWGAYLGLAAAVVALLQLLWRRTRGPSPWPLLGALVLGLIAVGVPWYWLRLAERVPPIHDISTDTQDPPLFVAVLPLRAGAPNAATYGGDSVAMAQKQAYPDIGPLELAGATPGAAFDRALAAARHAGWAIVAADSAEGRIEATATTGWFGFKDDVVIRIRADGSASRIDVRSVSRVGGSDVGTNARRIRSYLRRVAEPNG